MKNPCKSYTLNIMSLISLLCFAYYGKELINMFVAPSGGDWDIIGFMYVPASFIFLGCVICGILIESQLSLAKTSNYSMNFPYKKIPCKIIYYPLFYFGLLYGSFWGLYTIIAIPFMFLFT